MRWAIILRSNWIHSDPGTQSCICKMHYGCTPDGYMYDLEWRYAKEEETYEKANVITWNGHMDGCCTDWLWE